MGKYKHVRTYWKMFTENLKVLWIHFVVISAWRAPPASAALQTCWPNLGIYRHMFRQVPPDRSATTRPFERCFGSFIFFGDHPQLAQKAVITDSSVLQCFTHLFASVTEGREFLHRLDLLLTGMKVKRGSQSNHTHTLCERQHTFFTLWEAQEPLCSNNTEGSSRSMCFRCLHDRTMRIQQEPLGHQLCPILLDDDFEVVLSRLADIPSSEAQDVWEGIFHTYLSIR